MREFVLYNDLNIPINCSVVATTEYNEEKIIIFTDFLDDKNGNIRLLTAKYDESSNYVIPFSDNVSEEIINDFKKIERNLIDM